MSVDISKPVEQMRAEAKKDLDKALPTEQAKTEAGDKLQNALNNDPEIKKKAYEDVKVLAETIRNIRAGFIIVSGTLVGFDAAKYKDKDGNLIQLGPTWSPYIKQFDDTLQFSLEQATAAATMMKSINNVLGDVSSGDAADLKAELQQFMKQLKKKEADSLAVKDKFQKLADAVQLFVEKIDVALEKASEAIIIEFDRTKKALFLLQMDLKVINDKITVLGVATVTAVATGVGATAAAIVTLSPVAFGAACAAFIGAIGTGIALKKAFDERDRITRAIKNKGDEITTLNARFEVLNKYKTELDKTKLIVHDISSQIACIANIWKTINLDMHALNDDLEANVGPDAIIKKFFFKKLQVARELYKHLILVLETYVEQTRQANQTLGKPPK